MNAKEISLKRLLLPALILLLLPMVVVAKDFKNAYIKTDSLGNIPFPHEPHLKKLGSNCTLCHNSVYKIGEKNPAVTMAEMEKGKSCGKCHNKTIAFGLNECALCHKTREIAIN